MLKAIKSALAIEQTFFALQVANVRVRKYKKLTKGRKFL